jgi:hypothetical protein
MREHDLSGSQGHPIDARVPQHDTRAAAAIDGGVLKVGHRGLAFGGARGAGGGVAQDSPALLDPQFMPYASRAFAPCPPRGPQGSVIAPSSPSVPMADVVSPRWLMKRVRSELKSARNEPNSMRRWRDSSTAERPRTPDPRSTARSSASERTWAPRSISFSRGRSFFGQSRMLMLRPLKPWQSGATAGADSCAKRA